VEAIQKRFVPVKLYLGRDRDATRRYRPFWTPTLYFLGPDGHALVDWPGFIPPESLLVLLDLGEALVGLRRGRFQEALDLLEGIPQNHPRSAFAPEALWWAGVVHHVAKGDSAAMARAHRQLLERYPESPAALRL